FEVTTPGVHTVNVWMREDGLIVDKLVLTTDAGFDPVAVFGDQGPPESPRVERELTAPEVFPNGGTFSADLAVSLTSLGDTIYYTTDGSEPTMSSNVYSGPFVLSETTTLKATAFNTTDGSRSPTTDAVFSRTACSDTRIMAVGDSITLGRDGNKNPDSGFRTSYRQDLFFSLVEAGSNIDFVGSLDDGELEIPVFDSEHEGRGGWRDDQVAANIFSWLFANPADIVLLHIGTNGLNSSAADVSNILDEVDRFSPDTHVVVAKIINRQTNSPLTSTFNSNVESMVLSRIAAGDNLSIVDMETALTYPEDLVDNLHPSASGFKKMADVWFSELSTLLPACAQ
ncbi:MAG: chitobiase/beta-hexosaminidase C-terminal domain-containing protein, partial [Pseudomonadota bacterium]